MAQLLSSLVGLLALAGAASASSPFLIHGESVPADTIRITALGSGSPIIQRHQVASGFLIELGNGDKFIFDLGSGSYVNLRATGVSQADITKVFLSHLHSDHIADLASLYVGRIFGRRVPWEVWGPSGETPEVGAASVVGALRKFLAWDTLARRRIDFIDQKDHGDLLIVHEFDSTIPNNLIYDRNGVKVYSTPVPHYETQGPVSLRLEWNGLSVIHSGDMRPNQNFEDLAKGADLVILQAVGPIVDGNISALSYAHQYMINTSHIIPEQAGPILQRLQPRLAVLHHLIVNDVTRDAIVTAVRANYPKGDIHINEDLDVYEVTKERITLRRWLVPERSWGFWTHDPDWTSGFPQAFGERAQRQQGGGKASASFRRKL